MAKETAAAKALREEQERLDAEDMGTGNGARDGVPAGDGDGEAGAPVDLASRRGKTAAQTTLEGGEEPVQSEDDDGQQAWDVDPTGKRMTLGSLIPKNVPVEYKTKVDGTSTKLKGGINDPSIEQIAVSALFTSKFEISYTRDDRGQIVKCIVTEHKAPRAINPAGSEAGQLLLGEVPAAAAG